MVEKNRHTEFNIGYHLLVTKFIASSPNFLSNYHQQCLFCIYFFITKFNYVSPKYLLIFYTNFQSPNLTNFTIKGLNTYNLIYLRTLISSIFKPDWKHKKQVISKNQSYGLIKNASYLIEHFINWKIIYYS